MKIVLEEEWEREREKGEGEYLGDDCASLGFFPSYFKSVYLTTVGISIIGGQSQFYGHRNLKVIPGQRWRRFKVEIWYALYWNSECNFVGWPRGALRTTIYIGTYIENSDFFSFSFFFSSWSQHAWGLDNLFSEVGPESIRATLLPMSNTRIRLLIALRYKLCDGMNWENFAYRVVNSTK